MLLTTIAFHDHIHVNSACDFFAALLDILLALYSDLLECSFLHLISLENLVKLSNLHVEHTAVGHTIAKVDAQVLFSIQARNGGQF